MSLIHRLPPSVVARLRGLRSAGYWLLEPFDALVRRVNHLENYPPIPLRRHVGHLGGFDGVSCEVVAYSKLLCGLTSSSRVLDIACGCALLELELEKVLPTGECYGIDIHKPSIDWAHRTVHQRNPRFHFIHADIHNAAYWPSGRLTAAEFFKDFKPADFDLIYAKSLFTHMLPDELELYLREIAQRLKPTGKALVSFFLLNSAQEELDRQGKNSIAFQETPDARFYRVRYRNAPTAAVAYTDEHVLDLLTKSGLTLGRPFLYGSWSGRDDGLSYQDLAVVQRA